MKIELILEDEEAEDFEELLHGVAYGGIPQFDSRIAEIVLKKIEEEKD